jgi:hypothetical protein
MTQPKPMHFSSMATAFANAKVNDASPLLDQALNSLVRYANKPTKPAKDWTAKLSYKTARYLGSKGVPLQ